MVDDPYVDPTTGVLYNLLGITDPEKLVRAEADYTRVRIAQLAECPVQGNFGLAHLQGIHRHIFQDLYTWAGQLRTVPLAKTDLFCLPQHIESYAGQVFSDLSRRNYLWGLERAEFVAGIAHVYADVNALHPFREGNGRTQRTHLGQLARSVGWEIAWEHMEDDRNVQASIASLRGGEAPLREMLDELIEPTGAVTARPANAAEKAAYYRTEDADG